MNFKGTSIIEVFGEFLGTMVLMFLGQGSTAHFVFAKANDRLMLCFGWSLAVFFGIIISHKISGAHLNLAVTVSLAFLKKFEYKKIPLYFLGQLIGSVSGTLIAHLLYYKYFKGENKFIWATSLAEDVPLITGFFTEFILTGMLMTFVLVGTNENICGKNSTLKIATIISLTVLVIGICYGELTGFALNPSRDIGGRIVSAIFFGAEAFSRCHFYFWVPIIAPILGASFFGFLYTSCLKQFKFNDNQKVENENIPLE